MAKLLNLIFGDQNKKMLSDLRKDVDRINALEESITPLNDDQLRAKTDEFKKRLADGESIDDMVHEVFAVVREVAKRTLGQRHYDVQLIGGLVMMRNGIAEMRTGEGKTLTSTAPLYARALEGKGAHLITVNDYLAKRDAAWMGQIFHFLGLSVGCIQHEGGYVYDPEFILKDEEVEAEHDKARDETGSFKVDQDYLRPVERADAYKADITYGTNNEFGFDYLRDNMAPTRERQVMRGLHFAIIDEVDSILIDEARTPLIISAPAEEVNAMYQQITGIIRGLKVDEDYNLDEKMRAATFTEEGIQKVEKGLGISNLYEPGSNFSYFADTALKAYALYEKDVHYVVREGQVVIVDEFTGRMMEGRRFSEGIHQAIEAKEGVEIKRESRTLATITFQNLFRMYSHLCGMTGTAATEAEEFGKIYDLDVVVIPTNLPIARQDLPDRVYKNQKGKYEAAIEEIRARHEKGQPVLVGTASIEQNELLGMLLTKAGLPFNLLNAKNHESEGEIIAQAGRKGAITIATNMAGRGVDIKLGGNPATPEQEQEVKDLGGLYVLGTERHESRRIDNQLRGRSGRQGDPGATQFYLSMEDNLMRIFGSDRTKGIMDKLGIPENMPIENKMVTNAIEKSQQRVESHHFDMRKHLLEYDDVLNKHRESVYARRDDVLDAYAEEDKKKLREGVQALIEGEIEQVALFHTGGFESEDVSNDPSRGSTGSDREISDSSDYNGAEIVEVMNTIIPLTDEQKSELEALSSGINPQDKPASAKARTDIIEKVMSWVNETYDQVEESAGGREALADIERGVMLRAIDTLWIDHLAAMTALRTGIGLQGYGQRDPLIEYKKQSYGMFQNLLQGVNTEIVYNFFKSAKHVEAMKAAKEDYMQKMLSQSRLTGAVKNAVEKVAVAAAQTQAVAKPFSKNESGEKVGRNDDCPCGSGKKYKKCHGA